MAQVAREAVLDADEGRFADRIRWEQSCFFQENGYLILPAFFSPAEVAAFRTHLDALWDSRRAGSPFVMDCYLGTARQKRDYFRNADEDVRAEPYKLNDLHLDDPVVQHTCLDSRLVAVLENLLGARPVVINTLLMEYGSQQSAHFDTFYMPSRTPNLMAASWIGMEATNDDNGPLFFYPRSHLIPPRHFSHGEIWLPDAEVPDAMAHAARIVEQYGLREHTFYAHPGDVLIWHAQLLHGGKPIKRPGSTRLSLVTHYHTMIDVADPANRIDLGDGRLILKRPHCDVLDAAMRAKLEDFMAGLKIADEHRSGVPQTFDPIAYLVRNRDVREARIDPYAHYCIFGRSEGRAW